MSFYFKNVSVVGRNPILDYLIRVIKSPKSNLQNWSNQFSIAAGLLQTAEGNQFNRIQDAMVSSGLIEQHSPSNACRILLEDIRLYLPSLITLLNYHQNGTSTELEICHAHQALLNLKGALTHDDALVQGLCRQFSAIPSDIIELTESRLGSEIESARRELIRANFPSVVRSFILELPIPLESLTFPFIPTPTDFDAQTKDLIRRIAGVLGSTRQPIDSPWIQLVSAGYTIGHGSLNMLATKGNSGADLDRALNRLQHIPDLHSKIVNLIKLIRSRAVGQPEVRLRFLEAEKRIGSVVDSIPDTLSLQQQQRMIKTIEDWQNKVADLCSVGIDLQILDLHSDIETIVMSNQLVSADIRPTQFAMAFQANLVTALQEIGIPIQFCSGVHEFNSSLRLLYKSFCLDVPACLYDENQSGFEDVITANQGAIARILNRPDYLIATICEQNPHLPFSGIISALENQGILQPKQLTSAEKFDLAIMILSDPISCRAVLNRVDYVCLLDLQLKRLGYQHGLLSAACQSGNVRSVMDVMFTGDRNRFFDPDTRGLIMIDYAILGGNVEILTHILNARGSAFQNWTLDYHIQNQIDTKGPTILDLAAESGSVDMLRYIAGNLRHNQTQWPTWVEHSDAQGYNVYLRACMVSAECCKLVASWVDAIQSSRPVKTYYTTNHGQTGLHLAVQFGPAETVELLKNRYEADARIPSTGMVAAHLAMMRGDRDVIKHVFSLGGFQQLTDLDYNNLPPLAYAPETDIIMFVLRLAIDQCNKDRDQPEQGLQRNLIEAVAVVHNCFCKIGF